MYKWILNARSLLKRLCIASGILLKVPCFSNIRFMSISVHDCYICHLLEFLNVKEIVRNPFVFKMCCMRILEDGMWNHSLYMLSLILQIQRKCKTRVIWENYRLIRNFTGEDNSQSRGWCWCSEWRRFHWPEKSQILCSSSIFQWEDRSWGESMFWFFLWFLFLCVCLCFMVIFNMTFNVENIKNILIS